MTKEELRNLCFDPAVLSAARDQAKLTLEEVSNVVGVSVGSLSHYELGRRRPDPTVLLRLCLLYGLSPERLVRVATSENQSLAA